MVVQFQASDDLNPEPETLDLAFYRCRDAPEPPRSVGIRGLSGHTVGAELYRINLALVHHRRADGPARGSIPKLCHPVRPAGYSLAAPELPIMTLAELRSRAELGPSPAAGW